ncbi:MAG: hypothetical protein FWC66_08475 [Oscillospiraceae bacterium]|nr:hypothetical protein [Oscillospiraceae bacterium]
MVKKILSFQGQTPNLTFQDQQLEDIHNVFLNFDAKEFVTVHKIQGIRGFVSEAHDCKVVVDSERYFERMVKDKIEGVSLEGIVFFIPKNKWIEKFRHIPKVESTLKFDGKQYVVSAVAEEMGVIEFTLEAIRGR